MSERPTLFVGSSTEALPLANAIATYFDKDFDVKVWDKRVFDLGQHTLAALISAANSFDFAIFVMSSDDTLQFRDIGGTTTRANVLFELGLFMGALGSDRVFGVFSDEKTLFIPSDFHGVTVARYRSQEFDKGTPESYERAVDSACRAIKRKIDETRAQLRSSYLSRRMPTVMRAYLAYPREGKWLIVNGDPKNIVKRFDDACHTAWEDSQFYNTIDSALDGNPFGLYICAFGGSTKASIGATHFLQCCMRRHKSAKSTMLEGIISQKEYRKPSVETVKDQVFGHHLLSDALNPAPLAVLLQCDPRIAWNARAFTVHSQNIMFAINISKAKVSVGGSSDLIAEVAAQLLQAFSFQDLEERLKELSEFYDGKSPYMGTKIRAILLLPIQGYPGITIEILTQKTIRIEGADLPVAYPQWLGNNRSIVVGVDEIMAVRLAGERFMASLARSYAKDKLIYPT